MSEHRVTLTEGLRAPARARAWIGSRTPRVPDDVRSDILLLVSELVTNAVRHGSPEVVLVLHVLADRVRVEVQDGSDELPVVPARRPSAERPTGRGLLIIAATAVDWGVELRSDRPGKVVWAELHWTASVSA
ncbi:MAG: ATP-binding protein [Jatrophihabitantaceae bacterium]